MNRRQGKEKSLWSEKKKCQLKEMSTTKTHFFFFPSFFSPPAPRNSAFHGPVKIQTHYFKADVECRSCQEDLMLMQSPRAAPFLLRNSLYQNFFKHFFERKKKKQSQRNQTWPTHSLFCHWRWDWCLTAAATAIQVVREENKKKEKKKKKNRKKKRKRRFEWGASCRVQPQGLWRLSREKENAKKIARQASVLSGGV